MGGAGQTLEWVSWVHKILNFGVGCVGDVIGQNFAMAKNNILHVLFRSVPCIVSVPYIYTYIFFHSLSILFLSSLKH